MDMCMDYGFNKKKQNFKENIEKLFSVFNKNLNFHIYFILIINKKDNVHILKDNVYHPNNIQKNDLYFSSSIALM